MRHQTLEYDVINGEVVPIRISLLGHIFHKMTHFDYMAFAGADSESYIKYCEGDGPVLIYSLKTETLSEIKWINDGNGDDLYQVDWNPEQICGR